MTTEEIFRCGVTPKVGDDKGKRFTVKSITAEGVVCEGRIIKHGEYDLWREPATLFENHRIPSTWGNLKKAVEAKGMTDDTSIMTGSFPFGTSPARFSVGTFDGHPCIFID